MSKLVSSVYGSNFLVSSYGEKSSQKVFDSNGQHYRTLSKITNLKINIFGIIMKMV